LDQREVLQQLCEGIRYLGRAESLVECALGGEVGQGFKCDPVDADAVGAVRVLVPDGSVLEKDLTQTADELRKARRLQPLGTRYQSYSRPDPKPPSLAARRRSARGEPSAVRLALGGDVQPSRFQSVSLGHQLHRASVAKHAEPSPTLSGRDGGRKPLQGKHLHAHFFAIPEQADLSGRRISSAVIWASNGFSDSEVVALESITRLSALHHAGLPAQRCAVMSVGDIEVVAPELVGKSRTWISVTPYSPVHHHRGTLVEQLHKDVDRELLYRGLPTVREIELLDGGWLQYRRYRPDKERIRQQRPAYGLRLEFDDPISGPLALGQLSHFGLGLFQPVQQ